MGISPCHMILLHLLGPGVSVVSLCLNGCSVDLGRSTGAVKCVLRLSGTKLLCTKLCIRSVCTLAVGTGAALGAATAGIGRGRGIAGSSRVAPKAMPPSLPSSPAWPKATLPVSYPPSIPATLPVWPTDPISRIRAARARRNRRTLARPTAQTAPFGRLPPAAER